MIGFEPGSSGIVSNRSANCATTTSQFVTYYFINETAYHLGQYEPYSPSTKKLHASYVLTVVFILGALLSSKEVSNHKT